MPTADHVKRAAQSHAKIRAHAHELSAAEAQRRLEVAQQIVATAEAESA